MDFILPRRPLSRWWQVSVAKPVSKTCLKRSTIAPLMIFDVTFKTPTAYRWLITRCIPPLATYVAHTDYALTMLSSWPVLWQYVRMF